MLRGGWDVWDEEDEDVYFFPLHGSDPALPGPLSEPSLQPVYEALLGHLTGVGLSKRWLREAMSAGGPAWDRIVAENRDQLCQSFRYVLPAFKDAGKWLVLVGLSEEQRRDVAAEAEERGAVEADAACLPPEFLSRLPLWRHHWRHLCLLQCVHAMMAKDGSPAGLSHAVRVYACVLWELVDEEAPDIAALVELGSPAPSRAPPASEASSASSREQKEPPKAKGSKRQSPAKAAGPPLFAGHSEGSEGQGSGTSGDVVRFDCGDISFAQDPQLDDSRLEPVLKELLGHFPLMVVVPWRLKELVGKSGAEWTAVVADDAHNLHQFLKKLLPIFQGVETAGEAEARSVAAKGAANGAHAAKLLGLPAERLACLSSWRYFFRHCAIVDGLRTAWRASGGPEHRTNLVKAFVRIVHTSMATEVPELAPKVASPSSCGGHDTEANTTGAPAPLPAIAHKEPTNNAVKPQKPPSAFAGLSKGFFDRRSVGAQTPTAWRPEEPPSPKESLRSLKSTSCQTADGPATKSLGVQANAYAAIHSKRCQAQPDLRPAAAQTARARRKSTAAQTAAAEPAPKPQVAEASAQAEEPKPKMAESGCQTKPVKPTTADSDSQTQPAAEARSTGSQAGASQAGRGRSEESRQQESRALPASFGRGFRNQNAETLAEDAAVRDAPSQTTSSEAARDLASQTEEEPEVPHRSAELPFRLGALAQRLKAQRLAAE